jgi:hypothetical protein
MKMKTYREQLHEELLKDTREFCCYCMTERHKLACCGEVHYVTYKDMYEDDQKEFLENELEEYENWAKEQK